MNTRSAVSRLSSFLLPGIVFSLLSLIPDPAAGQLPEESGAGLTRYRYKGGEEMLRAFAPISSALRHSIAKLDVDGSTAAIATVIDTNGLALTKASEIKAGKLTSWIAGGKEVNAELLATDDQSDLALVRIHATGLIPVDWSTNEVAVGQWTVSPGTEETPQAVGIISVAPRKIPRKRAFIGVEVDMTNSVARISRLTRGLGAEKAGIMTNDVILSVNGARVENGEALVQRLGAYREGQTVKLHVKRADKEFDVEIKLIGERALFGRRQNYMERMGSEISQRAEDFGAAIQHDTVLEAWFCGGPLVDLDKKTIGINIARAGRVASYALPANLAREALARLRAEVAAGESAKK